MYTKISVEKMASYEVQKNVLVVEKGFQIIAQ